MMKKTKYIIARDNFLSKKKIIHIENTLAIIVEQFDIKRQITLNFERIF